MWRVKEDVSRWDPVEEEFEEEEAGHVWRASEARGSRDAPAVEPVASVEAGSVRKPWRPAQLESRAASESAAGVREIRFLASAPIPEARRRRHEQRKAGMSEEEIRRQEEEEERKEEEIRRRCGMEAASGAGGVRPGREAERAEASGAGGDRPGYGTEEERVACRTELRRQRRSASRAAHEWRSWRRARRPSPSSGERRDWRLSGDHPLQGGWRGTASRPPSALDDDDNDDDST